MTLSTFVTGVLGGLAGALVSTFLARWSLVYRLRKLVARRPTSRGAARAEREAGRRVSSGVDPKKTRELADLPYSAALDTRTADMAMTVDHRGSASFRRLQETATADSAWTDAGPTATGSDTDDLYAVLRDPASLVGATVEVSSKATARFHTDLDATILCVLDGDQWVVSQVAGTARSTLAGVPLGQAALPVTTGAHILQISDSRRHDRIDLTEFASPGSDRRLAVVAEVSSSLGRGVTAVASASAGVGVMVFAQGADARRLGALVAHAGDLWAAEDAGRHAAQALALLINELTRTSAAVVLCGVLEGRLTVTLSTGLAVADAPPHGTIEPVDGFVTTTLPADRRAVTIVVPESGAVVGSFTATEATASSPA